MHCTQRTSQQTRQSLTHRQGASLLSGPIAQPTPSSGAARSSHTAHASITTHQETECRQTPDNDTVEYFAFGSNMATSVLQGRRHCTPLAAAPAIAPDYHLAFNIRGFPYRCAEDAIHPPTPHNLQGTRVCFGDAAAGHRPHRPTSPWRALHTDQGGLGKGVGDRVGVRGRVGIVPHPIHLGRAIRWHLLRSTDAHCWCFCATAGALRWC